MNHYLVLNDNLLEEDTLDILTTNGFVNITLKNISGIKLNCERMVGRTNRHYLSIMLKDNKEIKTQPISAIDMLYNVMQKVKMRIR